MNVPAAVLAVMRKTNALFNSQAPELNSDLER